MANEKWPMTNCLCYRISTGKGFVIYHLSIIVCHFKNHAVLGLLFEMRHYLSQPGQAGTKKVLRLSQILLRLTIKSPAMREYRKTKLVNSRPGATYTGKCQRDIVLTSFFLGFLAHRLRQCAPFLIWGKGVFYPRFQFCCFFAHNFPCKGLSHSRIPRFADTTPSAPTIVNHKSDEEDKNGRIRKRPRLEGVALACPAKQWPQDTRDTVGG